MGDVDMMEILWGLSEAGSKSFIQIYKGHIYVEILTKHADFRHVDKDNFFTTVGFRVLV